MTNQPFVITINHQLGSSGALVGLRLSEKLGIPFFDREILKRVSDTLHMAESDVANREERLSTVWDSISRVSTQLDPAQNVATGRYIPTDRELFQLESDTIRRIAEKTSAVFIGRCGRYILRDHPRHFKLLLHADPAARIERLGALYHLSAPEAAKLMEDNDRDRAAYIRTFTGQDWTDARLYDLCINTSTGTLDGAVDLALAHLKIKYP